MEGEDKVEKLWDAFASEYVTTNISKVTFLAGVRAAVDVAQLVPPEKMSNVVAFMDWELKRLGV